jgi:hypothetical protein
MSQVHARVGTRRRGPSDVLDRQQADETNQDPHDRIQESEVRNLGQRRSQRYFESDGTEQQSQRDGGAGARVHFIAVIHHSKGQKRQQAEQKLQSILCYSQKDEF